VVLAYVLLLIAIGCEVVATTALKFSEGFTRVLPSAVAVAGYVVSAVVLSLVLKRGLGLGLTYALWSAVGVAAVALIGAVFLGERFNVPMVAGLLLIVGGVALLELGQVKA
jgi:small multidrug resistance pump